MHILQVSNIVSHHQLPLARALATLVAPGSFRFATTQANSPERQSLGWDGNETEPWLIRCASSAASRREFNRLIQEAHVVICGELLLAQLRDRIQAGRLTFYMSERWWKPPLGMARLLEPRIARRVLTFRKLAKSECFHYLPIGSSAAGDMRRIASFGDRMWRWGYFPPNHEETMPRKRESGGGIRVLWVGRMLRWKRIDTLIRAVEAARRSGYQVTLTLVGFGPQQEALQRMVGRLNLDQMVKILPPQSYRTIYGLMQQHDVYVLASDGQEGWGAVANEAMLAGCVVVASSTAGAAQVLIRNAENGLLFPCGSSEELSRCLCALADDPQLRGRLAEAGRRTIATSWSPTNAAQRLVSVAGALLSGNAPPKYNGGPMSRDGL